jgi:hypothetical protein
MIASAVIDLLSDKPLAFEALCLRLLKSFVIAILLESFCFVSWTLVVIATPFIFVFAFKILRQLKLALDLKQNIERAIR